MAEVQAADVGGGGEAAGGQEPSSLAEALAQDAGDVGAAEGGEGAAEGGEAGEAPADAPEPTAEEKAAAERFRFADVDWDSREKAEASVKTLRGQYKSMLGKLETLARRAEEAERANEAWAAWHERRAAGGGEAQGSGQPGADPAAGVDGLLGRLDLEVIQRLADERGLPYAMAYQSQIVNQFIEEKLAPLRAMLEQEIRPAVLPLAQEAAQRQQTQQVVAYWQERAAERLADGTPRYPELQDEESARGVIELWQELNPELAYRPDWFARVVAAYRDDVMSGRRPAPASAGQSGRGSAGASRGAELVGAASRRGAALLGTGVPRTADADSSELGELKRALAAGRSNERTGLGIRR